MIRIPSPTARDEAMWRLLLDLAREQRHWTLIGARMVELHALEHGRSVAHVTVDADALADARERPNPVRGLAQILTGRGFTLDEPNAFGEAHTFTRDSVEIDVLAPDHLGWRGDGARTTVPPAHTVSVPGGRQALARSAWVRIELGSVQGDLPRPDLLGAILLKARAVDVGRAAIHRGDLALLLSLVEDPDHMATALRGGEAAWLRARAEMEDSSADCWAAMPRDARIQGVAALRILQAR